MKYKSLCRLPIALAFVFPLCAMATPLGVKPGMWEDVTTVTATEGNGAVGHEMIPKDKLKGLSPEQQEQMQRMFNKMKMENKHHKTTSDKSTRKSCVKPSDTLESLMMGKKDNLDCERKNVKETSHSVDMDISCNSTKINLSFVAHLNVKRLSSEHVVSVSDITYSSGAGTSHSKTDSHWISATCNETSD